MGYFPGKQTAKPSRQKSPRKSGGGGGSSPTPYKTSPALDPAINAQRMKANKARGLGDSQGRSPSDPNFGKGAVAPRSQFRTGGGASFKGGTVKTREVTPQEFQRSLASRQRYLKQAKGYAERTKQKVMSSPKRREGLAEGQRRADERKARIAALNEKKRIVDLLKGAPLSQKGRENLQATLDHIDSKFKPFISGKALYTASAKGKITKNLDMYLRKSGVGSVKTLLKTKYKKPSGGTISAGKSKAQEAKELAARMKGLREVSDVISESRAEALYRSKTGGAVQRVRSLAALAALGTAAGGIGVLTALRHPIEFTKSQIEAAKHPVKTIKAMGQEFVVDPVGTAFEYLTFAKGLKLLAKGAAESPAGRYVQEELFIRSMPKELQPSVRAIIKAAKVQERINPLKIKSLRSVDFMEVKSLTKVEAKALAQALRNTDSVVFGSVASRTLGGKRLPVPKDVDIATADIKKFNSAFIENLPKDVRKNYVVKAQKVYRRIKSKKQASDVHGMRMFGGKLYDPIFDVKPLNRLIPQRSLLTKRGRIPASGFVNKVKIAETIRLLKKINADVKKLQKRLNKSRTAKARSNIGKRISKLEKRRRSILNNLKPSELVVLQKVPGVGKLTIPTQKIVEVGGIKLVGFGEQTTRKALGTLQVLIEKDPKRAKDPRAFLIGLEVQLDSLKRAKPKTSIGKISNNRKIKTLKSSIKLLKSKKFARLINKKVPGLTKEFPLVAKLNAKRLLKMNLRSVAEEVKRRLKRKPKKEEIKKKPKKAQKRPVRKVIKKQRAKPTKPKKARSRLPKTRRTSRLPKGAARSRLPPSKLKRAKPSKTPSKLPKKGRSRLKPSKLKGSRRSKIPPSKLKTSASKIKTSKIPKKPVSKVPTSKIPKSPPSRLRPVRPGTRLPVRLPKGAPKPPRYVLRRPKTKYEEQRIIRWVKKQKLKYRPSFAAIILNITGFKIPKSITGFEIRPIIIKRPVKRKKRAVRKKAKKK